MAHCKMYIIKRNRWYWEIPDNMEEKAKISITPIYHSFNKYFLSAYYVQDTIQ